MNPTYPMIYCHEPEDEPNEEQLLLGHHEGNCNGTGGPYKDCIHCKTEEEE